MAGLEPIISQTPSGLLLTIIRVNSHQAAYYKLFARTIHSVPHNSNSLILNYRLFRRPPSAPKITPLTTWSWLHRKFTYLESKVLHLKFRVMRDPVYLLPERFLIGGTPFSIFCGENLDHTKNFMLARNKYRWTFSWNVYKIQCADWPLPTTVGNGQSAHWIL